MSYFFPLQSISGSYDNPFRKDADKKLITLGEEIHSFLPYKDCIVTPSSSGVYIDFPNNSLCPAEEGVINAAIDFYSNYMPTPIENFHSNWQKSYSDYKQARVGLANMVYISGFDNLTTFEKQIATQWFVLPTEQRNQVYSFDDQLRYGIIFHENFMAARDRRLKATALVVYNLLTKNQVMQIVEDLEDLPTMYVRFGKEGTLEGDGVGFFDFMLARVGTPYEDTGLLARDYIPLGVTLEQMVDTCMKILKSGIYPI